MEILELPNNLNNNDIITESFKINSDQNIYTLNIKIENNNITLNISDEKELFEEFEKIINFEEMKKLHNAFSALTSCHDFLDFIKRLIENNKLLIKKEGENQISIEIIIELLYKPSTIKIELERKLNEDKVNLTKRLNKLVLLSKKIEIIEKQFQEENKKLKEENIKIKEKITEMEKTINELKNKINTSKKDIDIIDLDEVKIDSTIMKPDELKFIKSAIEKRMNLKIKDIKIIYQATIDGKEPLNFHKKCDGKRNTLILYKSEGNRRFGGFASEPWESKNFFKIDDNCFLFSLDRKMIFPPKKFTKYKMQIDCNSKLGPGFLRKDKYCIGIFEKGLLKTEESRHKKLFKGDKHMLSECGLRHYINLNEYEVFKINFFD